MTAHDPSSFANPTEKRPRPRIESLADLIFGLSLSIGSIALLTTSAKSTFDINSHMLAFAFTFLILITAWIIYTTDMSVLPLESRAVMFLNVLLLLLVALVPYLLNTVEFIDPSISPDASFAIRDYSSSLFALDLSGILLILAAFAHVISIEENELATPEVARLFRNGRNRMLVLSVVMAASIAPVFWQVSFLGVPARIYAWYLPLVSYWVGRALRPDSRSYRLS